jgi:hypothetical protein
MANQDVQITLTKDEAAALQGLLVQLLDWVLFGAGVDAWLQEGETLLLAPDSPECEHLESIRVKMGW